MAFQGRLFVLQVETATPGTFQTIAGGKTLKVTANNQEVDITNKNSNGFKELGANFGVKDLKISAEGIFSDDPAFTLAQNAFLNGVIKNYQVILPSTTTDQIISGSFQISSLDFAGNHDDSVTYSISLSSSGEFTIADAE